MYRLEKEFRFESSHQLMKHDGKCARLHGHSWRGRLVVEGRNLIKAGCKENMLVDYGDIGKATKMIVESLDHFHLNDVLKSDMPTSEKVAEWCFEQARVHLGGLLVAVVIEETCTSRCEYRP